MTTRRKLGWAVVGLALTIIIPGIIYNLIYETALEDIVTVLVMFLLGGSWFLIRRIKPRLSHKLITQALLELGYTPTDTSRQVGVLKKVHQWFKEFFSSGSYVKIDGDRSITVSSFSIEHEENNRSNKHYYRLYLNAIFKVKSERPYISITDKRNGLFILEKNHKLESVEFNESFTVLTNDTRHVYEHLDPHLMSKLLDINNRKAGVWYNYRLAGNKVDIYSGGDDYIIDSRSIHYNLRELWSQKPDSGKFLKVKDVVQTRLQEYKSVLEELNLLH